MDYIITHLHQIWQPLLFLFFYLVLYFPIMVASLLLFTLSSKVFIFFVVASACSKKIIPKVVEIFFQKFDYDKRTNLISNIIKLSLRIQEDLTDYFPIKLPLNTLVLPLQKFLFKRYTEIQLNFLQGFIDGLNSNKNVTEHEEESHLSIWSKTKFWFAAIFVMVLINVWLLLPTLIFIFLIVILI